MPSFSDDDVIDYFVTEAVIFRHAEEQAAAAKRQEKQSKVKQFIKGKPGDPVPGRRQSEA